MLLFFAPFLQSLPSSIVRALPSPMGGRHHRSALCLNPIVLTTPPTTFETLGAAVMPAHGPYTVLAVYRPGSVHPTSAFFEEFETTLEQVALYNAQIVILWDLNLHLETPTIPSAVTFHRILNQFGLAQHVSAATQVKGGWMDVVIMSRIIEMT